MKSIFKGLAMAALIGIGSMPAFAGYGSYQDPYEGEDSYNTGGYLSDTQEGRNYQFEQNLRDVQESNDSYFNLNPADNEDTRQPGVDYNPPD